MSGGSMDYAYSKIHKASEFIQRELANIELRVKAGVCDEEIVGDVSTYYTVKYPDIPYLASPTELRKAVVERMREAIRVCRLAAIYAKRVEWLTSGDDFYEDFCIMIDKEVSGCNARGGVE